MKAIAHTLDQLPEKALKSAFAAIKRLPWKPVRRGPIYCAPACGGGCTWYAYQKALRDGAALTKQLGKGWETRVWENLGWHFESRFGNLKVHGDRARGRGSRFSYTAYFGRWAVSATSPRRAVLKLAREIEAELTGLVEAVNAVRSVMRMRKSTKGRAS